MALACREARAKLDEQIAEVWYVPVDLIQAFNGEIWAEGTNFKMTMDEAVDITKKRGIVPVGSGSFTAHGTGLDPVDGSGSPWQAYVYGCQVAEVEVDTVTGEVQVLGIWAAHDVGRAINPRGVEGQIEGGVVQGVGQALMEDYKLEDGHTTTHGFAKYILPTSLDVPEITSIIIEYPDPLSPLGAKGIGEPSLVPTAPAIMNAIYDAIGVRIKSFRPRRRRLWVSCCASAPRLMKFHRGLLRNEMIKKAKQGEEEMTKKLKLHGVIFGSLALAMGALSEPALAEFPKNPLNLLSRLALAAARILKAGCWPRKWAKFSA